MEVVATARAAVIIDDAYARPSPSDLHDSLQTLRRFLRAVPEAKHWFDATFGLSGSVQARTYFAPLLENPKAVLELWRRRGECPESERLLSEGLPDLVGEVDPLRLPLQHIEQTLVARGWSFTTFSELPDVTEIPGGIDLVVIDYVLSSETPADMASKIEESTQLLSELASRIKAADSNLPLIVLVSSRPNIERRHADSFRKSVGVQGAFFQFIKKKSLQHELGHCVDGFVDEASELQAYRRVHGALHSAVEKASDELLRKVDALELQDIAALHVGHLLNEGEAISDYVGWMLGQVLAAKIQQAVALAEAAAALPNENHRVLLGHLKPTQGIPALFCEISSVKTASGERLKQQGGARELRFGDLFVGMKNNKPDVGKFRLVISQTCDLLQAKITNGQALCVEGTGTLVADNEAALLRATLRQLDEKGSTLINIDKAYYQIEWAEANLVSVSQAKLKGEKGFRYLGRLNEMYALEAQHNALHRLGRIGVPVKPGYGIVFGALRISIWIAKGEVSALAQYFNTSTVVAVLRPRQKGAVGVLLSSQAKRWLVECLISIDCNPSFPLELKDVSLKLRSVLNRADFYLVCKRTSKGTLQVSGMTIENDPQTGATVEKNEPYSKLAMVFLNENVFGDTTPHAGVRLQLELQAIV